MNRRKREFTLIELLITVAIIAILAGLLLPALNAARGRAQAMACMNNIRQMSLGLSTYFIDSGDIVPPYERGEEVSNKNKRGLLAPDQLPWVNGIKDYIGMPKLVTSGTLRDFIYTTVPASYRKRLACPSPDGAKGTYVANTAYSMPRQNIGGDYAWTQRAISRITEVRTPSRKALLVEHKDSVNGFSRNMDGWKNNLAWDVHSSGISIAYCDGHVGTLKLRTAEGIIFLESGISNWTAYRSSILFGTK